MASTPALDRVDETVQRRSTDLVELSHAIHAEPELAFAEHRSCAKTQTLVAERGFEITAAAGGLDTAFRADFGSGPLTVGVCAEYDALPEIGHACGHNIIAAAAVGAALALADVADELGLLGGRFWELPLKSSVAEKSCCSTPECSTTWRYR